MSRDKRNGKDQKVLSKVEGIAVREGSESWMVALAGYKWVTKELPASTTAVYDESGMVVSVDRQKRYPQRVLVALGGDGELYNLSDVRGVYKTFIGMSSTEDSYLSFASKYGMLGAGGYTYNHGCKTEYAKKNVGRPPSQYDIESFYESYGSWYREQFRLRAVSRLWEILKSGNAKDIIQQHTKASLKKLKQKQATDNRDINRLLSEKGARLGRSLYNYSTESQKPFCVIDPDYPFLSLHRFSVKSQSPLSSELADMLVHALITAEINENLNNGKLAQIQIGRSVGPSDFGYAITPISLLGHMWWELSRHICGETVYRNCVVCGKAIEIGKGAFMSNREFCSSSCRQKDYRSKVRETKLKSKEGWSVSKLANHFNTTTDVIENWLAKRK